MLLIRIKGNLMLKDASALPTEIIADMLGIPKSTVIKCITTLPHIVLWILLWS